MKLHPPLPGDLEFPQVFRPSLAGERVGLVVALLFLVGGAAFLWNSEHSLLGWFAVAPIALLGGSLLALVAYTFAGVLQHSSPATRWVAGLTDEALYLNLRCYQNGHFGGDAPTVAALSFDEVRSVGRVVEDGPKRTRVRGGRTRHEPGLRRAWVELVLEEGVDTGALQQALVEERYREAPETKVLGITSRVRHHASPLRVDTPGRVLVTWLPGMLDALAERIERVPERHLDADEELSDLPLEERAVALARRGLRFEARDLLRREGGLEKHAAKARIEELERNAA